MLSSDISLFLIPHEISLNEGNSKGSLPTVLDNLSDNFPPSDTNYEWLCSLNPLPCIPPLPLTSFLPTKGKARKEGRSRKKNGQKSPVWQYLGSRHWGVSFGDTSWEIMPRGSKSGYSQDQVTERMVIGREKKRER